MQKANGKRYVVSILLTKVSGRKTCFRIGYAAAVCRRCNAQQMYKAIYISTAGWSKHSNVSRWKWIKAWGKPKENQHKPMWCCSPESLFVWDETSAAHWDSLTKEQKRSTWFQAKAKSLCCHWGWYYGYKQYWPGIGYLLRRTVNWIISIYHVHAGQRACAEWHEFLVSIIQTGTGHHTVGKELDQMGLPELIISYGTGWQNCCCTPFYTL